MGRSHRIIRNVGEEIMRISQLDERARYNDNDTDWDMYDEDGNFLAQIAGEPSEESAIAHYNNHEYMNHESEELAAKAVAVTYYPKEGKSPHKKGTKKYNAHMAAMHAEGYKVLPPMDSKYVERDGLEGPFTTLSGKVVYYDPKEGKYYDPDTDMYMSYDEWNAHNSDQSGMTEWVQEPHEGQKWTGQERNFIHDLCKRHDGIQMQWPKPQTGADGIKGPSPLWDEGNIMSNDADLQKLMSWVEQNKHDVESYFRSDFRVYSKDENGKRQGQSDGNQILSNINAKIAGESLELSELMINEVPWHRTHTVGNTTTSVNSRTGGIKATQVVGNPAGAHTVRSVNNHFNADGSQGQASATTTIGNNKVSVSGQIGGGSDPKITIKPIVKPKVNASKVREETEYSDKQIKMAFGILNDPRYRDGNYDGAYATIEKVAKGLARHPSVRNALKRANESVSLTNEEKAELNEIWPYLITQAATKIPPITYAGAGIAVADLATQAIDWIRSQIKSEDVAEGSFWGRDDMVKKMKDDEKARGMKRFRKTKDGATHGHSTSDPKEWKKLIANGYEEVTEDDKDDKAKDDKAKDDKAKDDKAKDNTPNDIEGFDPQTAMAIKQLKAKYPHADNIMSALMSQTSQTLQNQFKGDKRRDAQDKKQDELDKEHNEKFLDMEMRLVNLIKNNNLKENGHIAGEVAANDLHQKATQVIEKAKWQANNKYK